MTVAVVVQIPGGERVVVAENSSSDLHARLAAYYYIFGVEHIPTYKELLAVTKTHITHGPVNAKIYRNHFENGRED